jgi:hypothetical protein
VIEAAKWLVRCDALGLDPFDEKNGGRYGTTPFIALSDAVLKNVFGPRGSK